MSHKTIDQLDPAVPTSGADLLIISQDGQAKKITLTELATALGGAASALTRGAKFRGAEVLQTGAITATYPFIPAFNSVLHDTDNCFNATNPTRLTIPAGVKRVVFYAALRPSDSEAAVGWVFGFRKNGWDWAPVGRESRRLSNTGYTDNYIQLVSGATGVTAGDYFEFVVYKSGGSTAMDTMVAGNTRFGFYVIEEDSATLPVEFFQAKKMGAPSASEVIDLSVAVAPYRLKASAPGSRFAAGIAPSGAAAQFKVKKNGADIGTINFAIGQTAGTFTSSADTDFAAGDVRTIECVTPSGIANLHLVLRGALL